MSTIDDKQPAYSISVRFGDAILQAGHTSIPNLVLNHYSELGISSNEMMFVIHVWQYWWTERNPYPSLNSIASRMNISRRQARNYTQSLKSKGFLIVRERFTPAFGQTTSEYDFSPLLRAVEGAAEDAAHEPEETLMPPRKDSSEGGRKLSSGASRKDSSSEEDAENNTHSEEDINSNIRKVKPAKSVGVGDLPASSPLAATPEQRTTDTESVRDVLARRGARSPRSRPRPETETDEYQRIQALIADRAREFIDIAPLKSSTTRAWNLFQKSGVAIAVFESKIFQAKALTLESTARITKTVEDPTYRVRRKSKMAYFFATLEDQLNLLTPEERARRGGSRGAPQGAKRGRPAKPKAPEEEPTTGRKPDSEGPYAAYIKS